LAHLSRSVLKSFRIIRLQPRSHTTRSLRAGWASACALFAAVVALAGCQSDNSQRDLIARDRRMQEDQVYAMQDYVRQYQNLVCQMRSENASLRRQLAQCTNDNSDLREPQPAPLPRGGRPAPTTPQFQAPQTPSGNQPQPEVPDVPPLGASSQDNFDEQAQLSAADDNSQAESDPQVLTAASEEPVRDTQHIVVQARREGDSMVETESRRAQARPTVETACNVLLTGEVLESEPGGGPRLVIDVEPFDTTGRVESFDGNVSVVLIDQSPTGEQKPLGRWDFGPEFVRSAVGSTAGEPTIRLHIELPDDSTISENAQLWVRLVSSGDTSMLAHAPVDLTKPSLFSSKANKAWPAEELVVAANYEEPVNPAEESPPVADVATALNESKWVVAAPGKPANLPEDFNPESGGWRTSSQPIPPMMSNVMEESPRDTLNRLRDQIRRSQQDDATKKLADKPVEKAPITRPGWAPDRSGQGPHRVTVHPSWSASR